MHEQRRHRLGWFLALLGVVGVVTGLVPLAINGLRAAADRRLWGAVDFAAHGVEAMGLSLEWGLLSSAMGTCLGGLLLWAGLGWLRGLPSARAATWSYVVVGLAVNGADMVVFACLARPGAMRTAMLLADGVALLIPAALGVWLLWGRRGRSAAAGADGPTGR